MAVTPTRLTRPPRRTRSTAAWTAARRARALEHQVRRTLAQLGLSLLGRPDGVGAQRRRQPPPRRVGLDGDEAFCPLRPGALEHEEPDGPTTLDDHGLARAGRRAPHRVQRDGGRLDHRRLHVRQPAVDRYQPAGVDGDPGREASVRRGQRIAPDHAEEGGHAVVGPPRHALRAGAASRRDAGDDAVALAEPGHVGGRRPPPCPPTRARRWPGCTAGLTGSRGRPCRRCRTGRPPPRPCPVAVPARARRRARSAHAR